LKTCDGISGRSVNVAIRLNNPYEFFNRVIKVKFNFVGSRVNGFITSELKLFNQVFVRNLSKTSAFISIKVYVVNIKRCGLERWNSYIVAIPVATTSFTEFEVDFNFMVLKSDKGKSKTRVAAKPEFKRNVQSFFRHDSTGVISTVSHVISTGTSRVGYRSARNRLNKTRNVANHGSITRSVTCSLSKFIPDVEPITIVSVDTLATDFNFNLFDHNVTEPVKPTELLRTRNGNTRKSDLKINTRDKITITRDSAGYFATEISSTVKGLFNRFHRKICVSAIDYFPESYLRITSKVNILSTISDKLH